ncbi:MAG: NAD(P)H-binding protein [Woeseiaceae bacterium]|nr:NAD(P)H-binding protein [Woeseiaceae bacterium]
MRVAVIGGTGFVGSYIVEALLDGGHDCSLLVRPGSESKAVGGDRARTVSGALEDAAAVRETLDGADAAIYLVGILREDRRHGVTYKATQYDGVVRTADAARDLGIQRFLLMSANGVDAELTEYQRTKYAAERHVLQSGLAATVFRPSIVFGDPRGRMEFATQLYRDIVSVPLPAIGFHSGWRPSTGQVLMGPVHVRDVARAFVVALGDSTSEGQTYELCGPEVLSWTEMIRRIAATVGRNKIVVPMPISLMRIPATLLDWLPAFPVTRDQLTMLEQNNVCSANRLGELVTTEPRAFDESSLAYLRS